MRRYVVVAIMLLLGAALAAGCRSPIKRDPGIVFPGSRAYDKRVESLKITPAQAYDIALEAARTDNRLEYLSRRPTVIVKRAYVFSMPQPSGASLQGYHVNGDSGKVTFESDEKKVAHSKR